LPCSICLATPCGDAHHIKGLGYLSGVGMTAPDSFAMPLCRNHHTRMHTDTTMWHDQWEYIARTQARWMEENALELQPCNNFKTLHNTESIDEL